MASVGFFDCAGSLLWHEGSLVVTRRLTWALECAGSVVALLSCPTACGILVPRPGTEPVTPALDGGLLTTGLLGKSLMASLVLSVLTHAPSSHSYVCWIKFQTSYLFINILASTPKRYRLLKSITTLLIPYLEMIVVSSCVICGVYSWVTYKFICSSSLARNVYWRSSRHTPLPIV